MDEVTSRVTFQEAYHLPAPKPLSISWSSTPPRRVRELNRPKIKPTRCGVPISRPFRAYSLTDSYVTEQRGEGKPAEGK